MTPKNEITAETLMAFADGELDAVTAKRVEKAVAADPELAAQVEQHRALRATLSAHFDPVAAEPAPDRLAAMLQRPAEVVDLGAARKAREAKEKAKAKPVAANSNWWRSYGGIAAALVMGVSLGVTARSGMTPGGDFSSKGGALVASGGVARALDTQLASKDGPVLLSFKSNDGSYCRVFESGAQSGVACQQGGAWQVRQLRASGAEAKSEYRQAGSQAVMADAQEMMAGEPLDANAEKAAVAAGWK